MSVERIVPVAELVQTSPPAPELEIPLSKKAQTRNMIIYAGNVCLIYVVAPVIYIGIVQAVLCQKLGASIAVANLPTSLYLAVAAVPVLFAWYFPYVRLLRRVVVIGYAIMSLIGALVTAILLLPVSAGVKVAAVVLHGMVMGGALGVINTFEWEILIRGVPESLRGKAFSLALGVGPIMAVIGSLGAQVVLNGKFGNVTFGSLVFPRNFAVLYAATVVAIGLAALQSSLYTIPPPAVENVRRPFLSEVIGGFGEFFRYRLILIACIAFMLLYAGQVIMPNMTLFTHQAMGADAEKYVGYQDGLRFGFKVVAGLLLGWLLTRTSVKLTLWLTAIFSLLGVVCVLVVRGKWFLVSFGLLGAGELAYAYYSYYVLLCSEPAKLRRNMAFFSMIQVPLAFVPDIYGRLSDSFGIRSSFWLALVLIVTATVLVAGWLPSHPHPASGGSS
jgi:hypothetical protein